MKLLVKMNLQSLSAVNKTGNVWLNTAFRRFAKSLVLWKSNNITYLEGVFVALVIQHAMRINQAAICHMCPVWFYLIFLHYLIKGTIFRGKKLWNVKCVFLFSLRSLYEIFHVLGRIERDITINIHKSSDKSMCPGSTQPLKMSTRIFLGVKAAGA